MSMMLPAPHGHDIEVVEDGIGVQRWAAAIGAGPEDDVGV